jgi:hypothetical protein
MYLPGRYVELGRYIMSGFKTLSHTMYECKYHYRIFEAQMGEYLKLRNTLAL